MFDLFLGIKNRQYSIISTILADIFVDCITCQRSEKFFHGSNLVLHIWAMEHFMRRSPIPDSLPMSGYNWIVTHHKRVNGNSLSNNASEYMIKGCVQAKF